jgi:metal-sulfur cluster biosynthetic enzyme
MRFVYLLSLILCRTSDCFVSQGRGWVPHSGVRSATSGGVDLPPVPAEWQGEVLQQLKNVIDPDLGSDIVTLGFVQNLKIDGRTIAFDVELTTPACPVKEQFAADCERLVLDLDWTDSVDVTMTAQATTQETSTSGMSQVGAVIAVSSCKGGVGTLRRMIQERRNNL